MEAIGCAQAFVGNSCPGVYRVGEDEFVITRVAFDDETDETVEPKGESVASICTDLWWYSIVDLDEFNRRGCDEDQITKVEVRPGVYKFTHLVHLEHEEKENEPFIYTKIEWVRPPEPVKDYAAIEAGKNFTAGQVIYNLIQQYPDLYDGENAVQRVADHILCGIGGGGDWHPNGFVQYDLDISPDTPEVEIPVFDKMYFWYPMSEKYSALCRAAGIGGETIILNESFQDLARNIIKCILKHGSKSMQYDGKVHKSKNPTIAEKCLVG